MSDYELAISQIMLTLMLYTAKRITALHCIRRIEEIITHCEQRDASEKARLVMYDTLISMGFKSDEAQKLIDD